ncbi:MAG: shikimate dehydrogenase [Chloroflexi bacterium]|nr:MAG: shikimate dehydrogenase [Chloroflexota bacterium]TMB75784.1 MAG: shikimate dehydrogenase [Chloroflexota bacterium]TMB97651.1 MAG: shikimate dehydrogenase [Chloroflexota bacterium]TMC29299.1 MAG: shikimate dehydrogenase [Chloroflexota bacterium]TMC33474.1 MAG: shikimate dehydrogenase [Chloroflexota bacterium]
MSEVVLLGHPVSHSLSPAMHNAAFKTLGLPHRYVTRDVESSKLDAEIARLRSDDVLGANVTIPHKEASLRLVDDLAPETRAIGALNTIVRRGSVLHGANTDVHGFVAALTEGGAGLAEATVLVLGAGGAARACVYALLERRNDVLVANRSADRLDALLRSIDVAGRKARAASWPHAGDAITADAVVNTTPLGMRGEDPLDGVALPRIVVDIVPTAEITPLVKRARATENVAVVEGLAMLLHQAARSFELWTGTPAPIAAMRAALPR